MGLTLNANLDEMRELAKALSDESSACDALIEKTALHLKHLAELIDKYDSHQCRTDHEKLEIEIDDFVKILGKTRKKYLPLLKVMKKKFKKTATIA
jgi:DNA gyrase/topoisomerase IV subunit A